MRTERVVSTWTVILALCVLGFPGIAHADELSDLKSQIEHVISQHDALQAVTDQLLKKVQELERDNARLSNEMTRMSDRSVVTAEWTPPEQSFLPESPRLTIKGFGDFGYSYLFTGSAQDSAFWLGAQDFFLLAKLNDRTRFVLETDFHWHTASTTSTHTHLERTNLEVLLSNLAVIKAGKMHTALGYWNQAFHHGSWLQTTIFRPEIYEFERPAVFGNPSGGWLPVHSVGIELSGMVESEHVDVKYNIASVNGRAASLTAVGNNFDENSFKGFNALLTLVPHGVIDGLEVGVDFYTDKIPSDATMPEGIDAIIIGGFGVYKHRAATLTGETFLILHDEKATPQSYDTWGGYFQAEYRLDQHTPYYRLDFIDFGNGDPFWDGRDNDLIQHTLGLRWDIAEWHALKFEYAHNALQGAEDEHQLIANSSWTF